VAWYARLKRRGNVVGENFDSPLCAALALFANHRGARYAWVTTEDLDYISVRYLRRHTIRKATRQSGIRALPSSLHDEAWVEN
jgi:hypothetical protein